MSCMETQWEPPTDTARSAGTTLGSVRTLAGSSKPAIGTTSSVVRTPMHYSGVGRTPPHHSPGKGPTDVFDEEDEPAVSSDEDKDDEEGAPGFPRTLTTRTCLVPRIFGMHRLVPKESHGYYSFVM
jgi:hypothetical protein